MASAAEQGRGGGDELGDKRYIDDILYINSCGGDELGDRGGAASGSMARRRGDEGDADRGAQGAGASRGAQRRTCSFMVLGRGVQRR